MTMVLSGVDMDTKRQLAQIDETTGELQTAQGSQRIDMPLSLRC